MITSDTRSDSDPPEDCQWESGASDGARPPGTRYSYLIALLGRLDGRVTIDQIADAVHRWERETTGADGERTWYDIHDELFRVDLPVLDRAGVVTFDRTRGLVLAPDAAADSSASDSAPDEGSGTGLSPDSDIEKRDRPESSGAFSRSDSS